MHSNMNADEVVKGLQYLSGVLRAQAWHKARERKKEFATICSEASSLIESLQMQVAERDKALDRAIETLTKELVAAVEDLHVHGGCVTCKFCKETPPEKPCERFHIDMDSPMIRCLSYLWRGPQETPKGDAE